MGCGSSKAADDVGDVKVDDVKIMKGGDPEEKARKAAAAEAEAAAKREAEAARVEAEAAKLKAAQEAKEAAAAVALQSVCRGNKDRAQVELMKHACGNYRVNMQAETFGECMCGWPKSAHTAEALAKKVDEKVEVKRVNSEDLRGKLQAKHTCSCERYVVNMQSDNFGECMCGQPKAAHSAAALSAGEVSKMARVASGDVRAKFVQKQKVECTSFEADMTAEGFGMCTCGAPRADHSEAALAAAAKLQTKGRVASGELRDKFVQKDFCACEEYEVLMGDNSVAFGTCVCGEPRSAHSEVALQAGELKAGKAKKRKSAEVRKGFATTAAWADRKVVECEAFELDLSPEAAFGTCVCGQPKAKHSDAALSTRRR